MRDEQGRYQDFEDDESVLPIDGCRKVLNSKTKNALYLKARRRGLPYSNYNTYPNGTEHLANNGRKNKVK